MNDEERKDLAIQDGILRKRKRLQIAYNLYKMGYAWNYKERLVYEGFSTEEVDEACKEMFEIFENSLCSLNMLLGQKICEAYDGTNGNYKGSVVREAREVASMISKLMLDNGTRLYSDMESIKKGLLLYVTRYTLYEFGHDHDEAFTLSEIEKLTD